MDLVLHSERTRFALVAVAASAATFAALTTYNNVAKRKRREELSREVAASVAAAERSQRKQQHSRDEPKSNNEYEEELIREQLARNYSFFGEEGMAKVRKGSVVVVGCGGVGSWAAVMLVRSGISKIRLIDFDQVSLSSLNRHATATLADVGTPKARAMKSFFAKVAPWVEVDCVVDMWNKEGEEAHRWLDGVDWVVDAIDNITTKVDLLTYCHSHNIPVFASMGAGAKSDPTRIQIADISQTIYDPLARAVRRRLRLAGIESGVPVVYSTEVPGEVKLLPLAEHEFEKGKVHELAALDDFRVRILPVLGPLPSIFGLTLATYILCELAEKHISNPLPVKNRRKVYEKLMKELVNRESKFTGIPPAKLPIDEDDIAFIYDDLHRARSCLPPHTLPVKPALTRWNFNEPLSVENCVVMDNKDVELHEKGAKAGQSPLEVWGADAQAAVDARIREAQRWNSWQT